MPMLLSPKKRYIARRLAQALPTIFGVLVFNFYSYKQLRETLPMCWPANPRRQQPNS